MSTPQPAAVYDNDMAGILVQDPFTSELTVKDRCDRCGAQAYVRALAGTWPQPLLFCGHHGREHTPVLEQVEGIWIHDETDRLHGNVAEQKLAKDAV